MSKDGGGTDTGPMLEYGNRALDLQKEIYDQQRADAQPWYQTGTQSIGRLQTLLGLGGPGSTTSASSRQQLIDQYKPQFTSQSGPSTGGTLYAGPNGKVYDTSGENWIDQYMQDAPQDGPAGGFGFYSSYQKNPTQALQQAGFKALNQGPSSTTDTAALNAYVDNLLSQQQTNAANDPDFGKLAQSFGMDDYVEDPGYQFRLAEGNKALERKLNAAGKTYSPEAAKALLSYGQGLASEEYGNAYDRYNNDNNTLFGRLATLSGYGQAASGQVANAGSNYANQGTELLTGMGNSITSANIARANQGSSMFNTLLGAGAQLGSAYLLSDKRLKSDIKEIGEENGFPIYEFSYREDPEHKRYIGVMAQDVIDIDPMAVLMDEESGYYKVNYDRIGVKFREVETCH